MFWLMAWITAILGTTGLFSYWHNQERNEADYQSQRAAVKARLAMSLPHSVWQLDDENVRLTLDSELSWPSIIAISVKGNPDSAWAAATMPTAACATCRRPRSRAPTIC